MIKKTATGWMVDFYPDGRGGRRVRKKGFKTRLDANAWLRRFHQKGKGSGLRLSDLVDYWYQHHGHALKDAKYRYSRVTAIVTRLGNPFVADFTATDWLEYRMARMNEVSSSTVNHEQRYLKAVFSESIRLGRIQDNPIGNVRQLTEPHHEMMFLSLEQCRKLLKECLSSSNPFTWAVAVICLATGARWSEAEGLTWVNWLPGKVIFRNTKNGKDRAVPIDRDLQSEVEAFALPGPGRMFDTCRYAFRSAYGRCGYDTPHQLTHILRHTFASHYMMNGGDLLTLQRILGHGSINMTMKYAHLSPDYLESAVRLCPMASLRVDAM
ncbi:Site-specific recombinase XerD [Marinobacter persicus]|uniref:Site-specific recombinase XerD n=1 Tax=Marinobacter persicus TaxID=930118 RepID=A0A1I3UKQ1_9GAMM|nr:tyrosine-type recombinase/integrase [Marinobacter persicus]GHD52520.1 integrase [Marinobacter persicus]SFJ82327.1 Site-specific recombinase XerD [Marinobacter persicus]